jgi:hypothetical protein
MHLMRGIREDELTSAVSPRPPNPSDRIVARSEGYTYAANVCALCLVQGPLCPNPNRPIRTRFVAWQELDQEEAEWHTRREAEREQVGVKKACQLDFGF